MLEIVRMFESIRNIIKWTLESGDEKTRYVVFCTLNKFHDRLEKIYLNEILLKQLQNYYVIYVLFFTIIDMCHIEIL